MFDHDEQIFLGNIQHGKIFVLDNGIGDHIIFSQLLPYIRAKYPKYTLAVCYPDLFKNENTISIQEARYLLGDISEHNIYKWCIDNDWTDSLLSAYKKKL